MIVTASRRRGPVDPFDPLVAHSLAPCFHGIRLMHGVEGLFPRGSALVGSREID